MVIKHENPFDFKKPDAINGVPQKKRALILLNASLHQLTYNALMEN